MEKKMTRVEIKEEVINRFTISEKCKVYSRYYIIEKASGLKVSVRGKKLSAVTVDKLAKKLFKLRQGLETQLLIENGYIDE